ncbi:hypothetical protein DUNSADRAFT_634 [Dunaliella salina]|uniref:Uncharacterized protein n=1 Tax=Dunaliella salina TaxID=3046 RepID=A0ABQ7FYR5_DUNSA|nr:hypothetical protein DUNSADRAFT_634 [Dunaliella salina]|eukprot:KAF5827449.1 hypothetical protein DUNSADRAFT_634 [Dunaliella salina]
MLLLDHNSIVQLPEEVSWLTRLEKLSLNHNFLTDLPSGLAACTRLTCIQVGHNRLKGLPAGEHMPPSLEEFNAVHNQISHIPASWGKLNKLKVLNLDDNRINDVPAEVLHDCGALHTLCLHGCPIGPAQLQANPGFHAFEERRKGKYDKAIAGGVLMGAKQLDEGVDREKMHPR